MAVPIFLPGESSPAATVRIGRVFTDYQRKGFFRIGVLPLVAAEDIEVRFGHEGAVSQALAQLQERLPPSFRKSPIELRRIAFYFPGETKPRLQARRMFPDARGHWQLEEVVVLRHSAAAVPAASASLIVAGPSAGLLRWRSAAGDDSWNLMEPEATPPR